MKFIAQFYPGSKSEICPGDSPRDQAGSIGTGGRNSSGSKQQTVCGDAGFRPPILLSSHYRIATPVEEECWHSLSDFCWNVRQWSRLGHPTSSPHSNDNCRRNCLQTSRTRRPNREQRASLPNAHLRPRYCRWGTRRQVRSAVQGIGGKRLWAIRRIGGSRNNSRPTLAMQWAVGTLRVPHATQSSSSRTRGFEFFLHLKQNPRPPQRHASRTQTVRQSLQ